MDNNSYFQDLEIIEWNDKIILKNEEITIDIGILLYHDFTKIVPKKKKGDLICKGLRTQCVSCPLFSHYCTHDKEGRTLNEILETEKDNFDSRIYEAYKNVLDDEVEE